MREEFGIISERKQKLLYERLDIAWICAIIRKKAEMRTNEMFEVSIIKDELPKGAKVSLRTAVRAVICCQGKLLMVETNCGDYKFPGGGVETGESYQEALLREIQEETGYIDVTVGQCIGTAFEQNEAPEEPGTYFQMKSIYYTVSLLSRKKAPGILDDYEEKLGFRECFIQADAAYETNAALLEQGMDAVIPWLERETRVLKIIAADVAEQ